MACDDSLTSSHFSKCYKIHNLTDEEATLLEPASCAIHGMDKLKMPFGAKVLLIGAGPTGLILSQLIKVSRMVWTGRLPSAYATYPAWC